MSATETLRIAHSARCKLQMAVDRPDRNFRFILGHALTLDKAMLRIAEIHIDSSDDGDEEGVADQEPRGPQGRRISFSTSSKARHRAAADATNERKRSPPPHPGGDEDDDEYEEDAIEDDVDDDDLSLQRFPSASAQPPRRMDDDEGIEIEDEEQPLEHGLPSEDDLKTIMGGQDDEEMANMYNGIIHCPCNKAHEKAPKVEKLWDMPQKGGQGRIAVVQVQA